MYQAAAALTANARWQEAISENMSAAVVPGFKRTDVSFSSVAAGFMPNGTEGSQQHMLPQGVARTVFAPGEFRATGKATDVAVEGNGFFEVQMADGRIGYTRDGEFSVNAQGQLVTKQGYQVLSGGGPIQFEANLQGPISISPDGRVAKGSETRGQLKVVEFSEPSDLTPAGGGYFVAEKQGLIGETVGTPSIRSGVLEGANTSAVAEMTSLITAMRMFEANQKVIQAQDERMGKAIADLGGLN
jgi:flagellar basal-body rod protein FlgF